MGVDNPELTDTLSRVVFFLLSAYFVYRFFYGSFSKDVKPLEFSDKFEIGYIDDPKPAVKVSGRNLDQLKRQDNFLPSDK